MELYKVKIFKENKEIHIAAEDFTEANAAMMILCRGKAIEYMKKLDGTVFNAKKVLAVEEEKNKEEEKTKEDKKEKKKKEDK